MRAVRIASILAATLAGAALVSPAWAEPAGKADGTLSLDDQPTALTHAYVIEVNEIPEMHFGEGPTRYLQIMLTDRPLPEGPKPSDMVAHQLSFTGNLRGIGLDVDPATGEVMSGRTLLPEAERPQFFSVITLNTEPMVVLEDWAEADGRLHGKVRTPEPLEVVNFDGGPGPTAFTFEAEFEAPIIAAPKMAAELTGDAATQSAQAQALRSFIEAIARKDIDAIKAAVATGDPMADMLTAEDVEMMNESMFYEQPDADGVLANLSKVYVFDDDTAVVVLVHGEDSVSTFPLKLDGDAWKMGQP